MHAAIPVTVTVIPVTASQGWLSVIFHSINIPQNKIGEQNIFSCQCICKIEQQTLKLMQQQQKRDSSAMINVFSNLKEKVS